MSQLNSQQVEQLKELGAYLQQQRLAQAISVEQIVAKTYISARLLQSLETAQADALPEPVFVQGFIRRYADALGLDGTALSRQFTVQPVSPTLQSTKASPSTRVRPVAPPPPAIQPEPIAPPRAAVQPEPVAPLRAAVQPEPVIPSRSVTVEEQRVDKPTQPTVKQNRSSGILAAISVVALAIAAGLLYSWNQNRTATSTAQLQPQPPTPQPPTPLAVAPPAPPKPSPSVRLPSAPIEVALNLTAPSWIQVVGDGVNQFEGTLDKGTKKTWTAKQELVLVMGNAGGVLVAYNQKQPQALGQSGEVKTVTFTPKAMQPR